MILEICKIIIIVLFYTASILTQTQGPVGASSPHPTIRVSCSELSRRIDPSLFNFLGVNKQKLGWQGTPHSAGHSMVQCLPRPARSTIPKYSYHPSQQLEVCECVCDVHGIYAWYICMMDVCIHTKVTWCLMFYSIFLHLFPWDRVSHCPWS